MRLITKDNHYKSKYILKHSMKPEDTIGLPLCHDAENLVTANGKDVKNVPELCIEDVMEEEELILTEKVEFTIKGTKDTLQAKKDILTSINTELDVEIDEIHMDNVRRVLDSMLLKYGYGSTCAPLTPKEQEMVSKKSKFRPLEHHSLLVGWTETDQLIRQTSTIFFQYAIENNKEWFDAYTFKKSYYRFHERTFKMIPDPTKILDELLGEDQHMVKAIINAHERIRELKEALAKQKDKSVHGDKYKKLYDEIMDDQLLRDVHSCSMRLKQIHGAKWLNSFLYNFTMMQFHTAAAPSRQGLRLMDEPKFHMCFRLLSSVADIAERDGYNRMYGVASPSKDGGSSAWDPFLNPFAIP